MTLGEAPCAGFGAGIVRRTVEKPPELGEDFGGEALLPFGQGTHFYFGTFISTLQVAAWTIACKSLIC